jgi:hypothetical protein
MATQNIDVPQDKRIEFRIGIHVGGIIIDDNDIFGDGVNIAARLEGIAEPGGICVSDDAQRQIRGKTELAFDDMGPQSLKNIAEPMRAWRPTSSCGLKKTIRQCDLHHGSDYTPREGFEVTCWPVMTIARGQVVADNGRSSGPRAPAKSSVAANRA